MRFRYLAATAANERSSGWIDASSDQDAAAELRAKGLFVIRIRKTSRLAALWAFLNQDVSVRSPLTAPQLAATTQEWAGLLEAGISVEESLSLLIETARAPARAVLERVREDVKEGLALYEALARHPRCFPATYVSLVQAGETSGSLSSTLVRLADDLAAQRGVMEDIRNALLYPAFLLVTAFIGITTLLVVVVPNLEGLLGPRSYDTLPAATHMVIAISHALREDGLVLLLALFILTAGLTAFAQTDKGRFRLHGLLLRLPVLGPLVRTIETARFTRIFGAMLKGGVTVPRGMPLAIQAVSNRAMRQRLGEAHEAILIGAGIGDAIARSETIPPDAIGLIRMGERTGQLDAALSRTATLYEGRAARRLKALTTILTPVLTIGFGLLAGLIIYAMLSTILSINDLASQP
ncbi:type II secretion system F family protein [Microvirga sp. 2YAF29]|uniref:type II secretion system F family protein n=1 Tax=Microvirga sp. 2YAF29 TaxID=3233031 RepID=UPI003F9B5EAC